jgi:hypothetical protein
MVSEESELLVVELPPSSVRWLEIRASRRRSNPDEAMTRLLEGLPGLEPDDLKSLQDPPRERWQTFRFYVTKSALDALDEASRKSGVHCSIICRRVLYAIFVSRQIKFIWDAELGHFLLQRTQLHFDFADD